MQKLVAGWLVCMTRETRLQEEDFRWLLDADEERGAQAAMAQ